MRRRRRYYEPEDLGREQDLRDAADPNRRYYVYVLDTDYGHYVGHTSHVRPRVEQHQAGETPSTAGGNPTLVWESGPFPKRRAAASFEAELKGMRDGRHPAFRDYTGLLPRPFANPSMSAPGRVHRRGSYRRRSGFRRRSGLGRLLAREVHGILRSRRKRRMWGAVAVGVVLVVVYASNGGF